LANKLGLGGLGLGGGESVLGGLGLGEEDAGLLEGVGEKIGEDVGVGPADLVGIFELIDHAFPFLFAVFGDDDLFAVIAAEVHAHAGGVGFGMELGADHGFGKANGHDGSFEGDMGSFLFDGEDVAAHLGDPVVVGLGHLVATAVDGVEGVLEAGEDWFFGGTFEKVYGKNAEGGRTPGGDFGDGIVTADELKGMADEKDLFAGGGIRVAVVGFNPAEPAEVGFFPGAVDGIERAARATAGDIDIIREIGNFLLDADLKFVYFQPEVVCEGEVGQDLPDAAHSLVGLTFVEIEDGDPDFSSTHHGAKVRKFVNGGVWIAVSVRVGAGAGGGGVTSSTR
jgi:hypothetical protein